MEMKVISSSPTKVISVTGLITAKHNKSENLTKLTQATRPKCTLAHVCLTVTLIIYKLLLPCCCSSGVLLGSRPTASADTPGVPADFSPVEVRGY